MSSKYWNFLVYDLSEFVCMPMILRTGSCCSFGENEFADVEKIRLCKFSDAPYIEGQVVFVRAVTLGEIYRGEIANDLFQRWKRGEAIYFEVSKRVESNAS